MLTISSEAVNQVKSVLGHNGIDLTTNKAVIYTALRVGVQGGGCSGYQYKMDVIRDEDIQPEWSVEEHDGLKVYIDPISAMYLEGVVIDFVTDELGNAGFKFTNPNATRHCGCGKSFS